MCNLRTRRGLASKNSNVSSNRTLSARQSVMQRNLSNLLWRFARNPRQVVVFPPPNRTSRGEGLGTTMGLWPGTSGGERRHHSRLSRRQAISAGHGIRAARAVVGLKTDSREHLTPMLFGHVLLGYELHDPDAWYGDREERQSEHRS